MVELLSEVRSAGIKLQLTMNIILDASLYIRKYLLTEPSPSEGTIILLISASLYLSTKVNEYFGNEMTGHIRIRDFLNVVIYAKNEK